MAFYLSTGEGQESMVKFGSYDPEGFKDSFNMKFMSTKDTQSWTVVSKEHGLVVGDTTTKMAVNTDAIIEPAYPFIYVPDSFYQSMTNEFKTLPGMQFTDAFPNQLNLFKGSCDHNR